VGVEWVRRAEYGVQCYVQYLINHLTPNDLLRRRAVSPLKIKSPVKICVKNQQIHKLFIQLIN
jgi:hypothetical protein